MNESANESIKLLQESLTASLKKEMEMKASMSPSKTNCISFVDLQDSSPESVQNQRDANIYNQQFLRTLSTSIGCFNDCIIDDYEDIASESLQASKAGICF